MDFHERLKYLLRNEKIRAFEERMGFSNGSLKKAIVHKLAISSDRLEKMFLANPHWNASWLFTGKGVSDVLQVNGELESQRDYLETQRKMLMAEVKKLEYTITLQKRVIGSHDLVLDKFKRDLDECESRLKDRAARPGKK